jgi:hypothetical protein
VDGYIDYTNVPSVLALPSYPFTLLVSSLGYIQP